jgi:outer membrane receptor protein involved in Fe transport
LLSKQFNFKNKRAVFSDTALLQYIIMIRNFLILLFSGLSITSLAQNGTIIGQVVDGKTNETLIGVSCVIKGTTIGASTDFDGRFRIANITPGTYTFVFSYVSYQTKTITDVNINAGKSETINVMLETSANEIKEAKVTAQFNKQSNMSLLNTLRSNVAIADGISQDVIKRTPDKNVGEILKRVSGTSVQNNRFVIVRGMNDRYNFAMINQMPLTSAEPDRKAIAFDIFPSTLIDNLIVSKTASADMPGEFAGGIIQINTRDIPEENSVSINIGTGGNTISTFNEYAHFQNGGKDFWGKDDGTRALGGYIPETEVFQNLSITNPVQLLEISKQINNDWTVYKQNSMPLNKVLQATIAKRFNLGGKDLGVVFGYSYNDNRRYYDIERNDFNDESYKKIYTYKDDQFGRKIINGGILNIAFKMNDNNKISLKNMRNITSDDNTNIRTGTDFENERLIRDYFSDYTSTLLTTSQLQGDHYMPNSRIKISWGASISSTARNMPNRRRMLYNTANLIDTTTFYAYVPYGSASPNYAGKFYSKLNETIYCEKIDVTIPLVKENTKLKQSIRAGGMLQQKNRSFDARTFGFKIPNPSQFNFNYLTLGMDSIFNQSHMGSSGFILDEITNPSDAYTANATINAAYFMFENHITDELRLTWGIRYEEFKQALQSGSYTGNINDAIDVNYKKNNLLPSANIIYALNPKSNIRLSGSQTVARPEFRELAPFAYYDFTNLAVVIGNDSLAPSIITNMDLRYEFFPSANEMFSISSFFKYFKDPIEQVFYTTGVGSKIFSFDNIDDGKLYGLEIEMRSKLLNYIIKESKFADNLTFIANVALIKSEVNLANVASSEVSNRPLQGQSPYIINAGLTYMAPKSGTGFSLMLNAIGTRIDRVGTVGYSDILENRRTIIDGQISQRLFKNGEIKFSVSDLLQQPFVFFQDENDNQKYDAKSDKVIWKIKPGMSYSMSISYRF